MTIQDIINLLNARINQTMLVYGNWASTNTNGITINLSIDEARAIVTTLSKKNQEKFSGWMSTNG